MYSSPVASRPKETIRCGDVPSWANGLQTPFFPGQAEDSAAFVVAKNVDAVKRGFGLGAAAATPATINSNPIAFIRWQSTTPVLY